MESKAEENHEKIIRVQVMISPKQMYFDFCLAELKSLVALYGFDFRELISPEYARHGRPVPD